MVNKTIFEYNRLWQSKKFEAGRQAAQERIWQMISVLFKHILRSSFSGRLLDLGAGDGVFVEVCIAHGLDARGVDICSGIDFEHDQLPFGNSTFDVIMMYSVIEHLHDAGNILAEAHRVLKPQGKIIVITANFELEHPLIYARDFFNDPTHIHPYNRKSIMLLMGMHRFKKNFIGLWTVGRSYMIWKMPELLQFYYGAFLPFLGTARYVPSFLKGRSRAMVCIFEKIDGPQATL